MSNTPTTPPADTDAAEDREDGTAGAAGAAGASEARESAVSAADLEDLGKRYGMDSDLADALREGFRELKRAPGEAKRLGALMHGLARRHESEGRQTAEEIERVVAAIQRPRGEE